MDKKGKILYQYFKVKKDRQHYLGIRYFRVDFNAHSVLQLCIFSGDMKKGKANNFGMYLISKTTFYTNYAACQYVESCKRSEFEEQQKMIVKILE